MLKRVLPIALCGALLLSGCSGMGSVAEDKKPIVTGVAAGAATGAAMGLAFGDPFTSALIGGLLGGVGGLIYREYVDDD
ncbi:MAG: glycine zipper domain-containing protein [Kiloniellales bacterium]